MLAQPSEALVHMFDSRDAYEHGWLWIELLKVIHSEVEAICGCFEGEAT